MLKHLRSVLLCCGLSAVASVSCARALAAPVAGDVVDVDIPGTEIKLRMAYIPGGTFRLGSGVSEAGRRDDEGPLVDVEVEPFWMGIHEVTWGQFTPFLQNYNAVANQGPAVHDIPKDKLADAVSYPTPLYEIEAGPILQAMGRTANFPVVGMSVHSAKTYTKWLSKKSGHYFRLPTEAEWEYACRAGTRTAYFFGDDPKALGDYAVYFDNSATRDCPDGAYREVGSKKPNPWGLYDIHGNVAEWTLDAYDKDRYAAFAGKPVKSADLVNWPTKQYPRIYRGGGWEHEAVDLRSARRVEGSKNLNKRDPCLPTSPYWITEGFAIGFRVTMPANDATEAFKRRAWDAKDAQTLKVLEAKNDRAVREDIIPPERPSDITPVK